MSLAREAAQAYVDAVNAGDLDTLLALFAKDAVLRHPSGMYEGTEALAGFYGDVVFPTKAFLTLTRLLADGPLAMFELSASSPLAELGATRDVLDSLTVDGDGRIISLDVYYR
jgi:ketosteroid isomerase-like protein